MNNNQVDITKMSVIELKALVFDLLVKLENVQNNLNVVNAEIAKRVESEKVEQQASPKTWTEAENKDKK
jgi:hypothetical protein